MSWRTSFIQFTEEAAVSKLKRYRGPVKVAMETHWYSGKGDEPRSCDILRWVLRLQPQRRCCKRGRNVLEFDWLGYTCSEWVLRTTQRKLLATLLVPERYIREDFARMQSMRAIGISFTARDPYPLLSGLFFAFGA